MKALLIFSSLLVGASLVITNSSVEPKQEITTATSVEQLKEGTAITKVYLSNQGLESVPELLQEHQSVEKLVLANNFITTLPDFIQNLNQLIYLDLSNNQSIDLDQALLQLQGIKLRTLNLAECNLVYVPFKIGKIKSLKSLDLSNNHLIDLPFYLGKLKKLEYLNLANNEITSLDFGVWKCKKLKFIDLSGMKGLDMKNVCMNLQTLDQLQTVSMSYVNDTLPEEFGLVNTRQWDIDNSTLSYLPASIEHNTTLDEITFESCEGTAFEKIFDRLGKIESLTKLRISNSIAEIPLELKHISQITSLDLSHNKLTSLPLSEEDFPNLTELVLYGNNFSPEEWQRIQANFPNCNLVSNNIPKAEKETVIAEGKTSIQPPLPQVTLPVNTKVINTSKPNTLTFEETKINIPPDAFVDKNGNKVTAPVTIEYVQYDDPLEIFLSGIPMKYDSADVSTYFQSAGMFDISASANGEEVFLDAGKEVEVALATNSEEDGFSLYNLEESSGKWQIEGSTPLNTDFKSFQANSYAFDLPFSKVGRKPTIFTQQMGIALEKTKGTFYYRIYTENDGYGSYEVKLPSVIQDGKTFTTHANDNAKDISKTLRAYYHHKNNHHGTKPIVDISLELEDKKDCFVLSLYHPDTLIQLSITLNGQSHNYEKEQKRYAYFWKKYKKSISRNTKSNLKEIAKYEKALAKYEQELAAYEQKVRDYYNEHKYEAATRSVIISSMGMWNCDRIPRMEQPMTLALTFKDGEGKSFKPEQVTILDYSDVGTMQFKPTNITVEKNNEIGLIAFKGGDFIFIPKHEFEELKISSKKNIEAVVEVFDAKDLTEEAIQSMMN